CCNSLLLSEFVNIDDSDNDDVNGRSVLFDCLFDDDDDDDDEKEKIEFLKILLFAELAEFNKRV
ncbi:unnamed protein product, partial [Rotaria magnacalcarata]